MRVQEFNDDSEARVITGMVVNNEVLAAVADRWGDGQGPFSGKAAAVAGRLCVDFYRLHGQAPGKAIEGLYRVWREEHREPEAVAEQVASLLAHLSDQHGREGSEVNARFLIDLAFRRMNHVRVERAIEDAQARLDMGRPLEAVEALERFRRVEVGEEAGTYLFQDREALLSALVQDEDDVLITYPGGLGEFYRNVFSRESFVAYMGMSGSGKTWWLLDVAWTAMTQRKRVAFFEVGDMSKRQIIRRFAVRLSGKPLRKCVCLYPRSVREGAVEHEERVFDKALTGKDILRARKRLARDTVKSPDPYFFLAVRSTCSINVAGVRAVLDRLARDDGWVPDVVVIDYADILAPPAGRFKDQREQINVTWQQLRALSTDLHCSVVTATQSNRDGFNAETVRMQHASEDRRKIDSVTDMIGINVKDGEKDLGLCRLNFVKSREQEYSRTKCVYVAGCLALGNPAVASYYPSKRRDRGEQESTTGRKEGSNPRPANGRAARV